MEVILLFLLSFIAFPPVGIQWLLVALGVSSGAIPTSL